MMSSMGKSMGSGSAVALETVLALSKSFPIAFPVTTATLETLLKVCWVNSEYIYQIIYLLHQQVDWFNHSDTGFQSVCTVFIFL